MISDFFAVENLVDPPNIVRYDDHYVGVARFHDPLAPKSQNN